MTWVVISADNFGILLLDGMNPYYLGGPEEELIEDVSYVYSAANDMFSSKIE